MIEDYLVTVKEIKPKNDYDDCLTLLKDHKYQHITAEMKLEKH